jgi:hypothetical protein
MHQEISVRGRGGYIILGNKTVTINIKFVFRVVFLKIA